MRVVSNCQARRLNICVMRIELSATASRGGARARGLGLVSAPLFPLRVLRSLQSGLLGIGLSGLETRRARRRVFAVSGRFSVNIRLATW